MEFSVLLILIFLHIFSLRNQIRPFMEKVCAGAATKFFILASEIPKFMDMDSFCRRIKE